MDAWLDSWYDPTSGLHGFSNGLCVDDNLLYVADLSGTLKVFGDGKLVKSTKLNGVPSAVCAYRETSSSGSSIAVACGPSVYIYRASALRPSHKFTVDAAKVGQFEQDVWEKLKSGTLQVGRACSVLKEQQNLSRRSLDLLALENDPERLDRYVGDELANDNYKKPLFTCITCMGVLKKESETDRDGPGSLVLGTESQKILILDGSGRKIIKSITLRSQPVFLGISGTLDVEYRIVVACRDKRIYTIKNGSLVRNSIELEAPIAGGLVRCGARDIVVGCVDRTIHCFHTKGKKNWTLYMPSEITNISPFQCDRVSTSGFLVSLRDGSIRLYIDKTLMSTIETPNQAIVTGLCFGQFNREPDTLMILYTSGAIGIKILRRTAKLDPNKAPEPGPPPEQDIPLAIPKKTKLYLDQTQRERDLAIDMHRSFQHSLCKLRYLTAKSYVRLFQNGGTANSLMYTSTNYQGDLDMQERVNVSVEVHGLGPQFRLNVEIENIGALPILSTSLSTYFDKQHFHVENPVMSIPVMIPQTTLTFQILLQSINPGTQPPPIQLQIHRDQQTLINASVDMPVVAAET